MTLSAIHLHATKIVLTKVIVELKKYDLQFEGKWLKNHISVYNLADSATTRHYDSPILLQLTCMYLNFRVLL